MTDIADAALLQEIETNVRMAAAQTCQAIPAGCFIALIHPGNPAPWYNYAVPVGPDPNEADLAAVRALFASRGRPLRIEWTDELRPDLLDRLQAAGLRHESTNSQMVCTPARWRPYAADGVTVRLLRDDDDLRAYYMLTSLGFGVDDPYAGEHHIADLRAALRSGARYAIAAIDGAWTSVGGYKPLDGLTELVAIATHPERRRRGAAATLASFLLGDHFANGGRLAYLFATDRTAEQTYERIGFATIASRISAIDD